ncbi:MAG: Tat pathway signal protein, partial [Halobaculum sp.]
PEKSPLFMGFVAGFRKNQATESTVTLDSGPFAGGTTKVVANWRQRLDDWYTEQSQDQRVMEMFSPQHAEQDLVEGVGQNLGDSSGIDEFLDDLSSVATEYGRVGHAQKAARANRDADGNVRLLRRHFESTDDDVASLHFPSLQREISTFEEVRRAMNGTDLTEATPAVRQRVNNGILEYIFVRRRGYFLVPPREKRALPRPNEGG